MTLEECANKVIDACFRNVKGESADGQATSAAKAVLAALQALVHTETERNAAIFRRYVQAKRDAWGPGASNPPKTSDYLDEILGTLPGKGDNDDRQS
jgi:hypothetical protein